MILVTASTLASAIAGVVLAAAAPALPDAFWRLPAEVRDRATVVMLGTYATGRGPCEFLPDGSRRWALLRGFKTGASYRGDVRSDYLGVEHAALVEPGGDQVKLVEGREYLLLLRPSRASLDRLREPVGSRSPRDALTRDEVVTIVEP